MEITKSVPPSVPSNPIVSTTCKLYETEVFQKLVDGIRVAACMISDTPPITDEASVVRKAETLTGEDASGQASGCSSCRAGPFESRAQQTAHYKHHWHTHNLRRRLLGRPPLTFYDFNSRGDDVSGISDSDSDSDKGPSKGEREASDLFLAATRHCRAYFTNSDGRVLSVYRCLLHHKKEWIGGDGKGEKWVEACRDLTHSMGWAVIMCAGGHFAAAIFRGESDTAVKHKALHSYVTRRGQGKAQGNRDSKGNNAPRSAGASLRRYNQEQFAQHVQEVLTSWKDDLALCTLILYRAVGPLNKASIFGVGSPLSRQDPRLRTLPFPTRRPSFKEVRRAHNILSTVEIYESVEIFQKVFSITSVLNTALPERATGRKNKKSSPGKLVDRAKSREIIVRPTPGAIVSSEDEAPCFQQSTCPPDWTKTLASLKSKVKNSESETEDESILSKNLGKLDMRETLHEFDDSIVRKKGRRKTPTKSKPDNQKKALTKVDENNTNSNVEKNEQKIVKPLKGIKSNTGKVPAVVRKMWDALPSGEDNFRNLTNTWDGNLSLLDSINFIDPVDGNTILHKAALAELPDIVMLLLELGSDPCVRNVKLQTPYCVTNHIDTRNAFRLFQGTFPDKYQYAKANIPGPLTIELLEIEKERRAAQKKIRRQKERGKQQEKIKSSKFLELNDKQKMQNINESRCFGCGHSLNSMPFCYEEFKFCTIKCLQNHRNARPLNLSAQ